MKLAMYDNKPTFVALQNGQFWGIPITGYDSIDEILNDWQNFVSKVLINFNDTKIIDNDDAEQLDALKFEQPRASLHYNLQVQ